MLFTVVAPEFIDEQQEEQRDAQEYETHPILARADE
jgi:hypothetical protein